MKIRTYNINCILAIVAIYGFLIGSEVSSMSSFLSTANFHEFYGVPLKREQTLLAASSPIGAVVGCVIFGSFCDYFGFVVCFQIANMFWILGTGVVVLSDYFFVLVLGRLIKGSTVGLITCLVPIYISEIFPLRRKGFSISLFHVSTPIGSILMYFLGIALDTADTQYVPFKLLWALEGLPVVLVIVLAFSLPESPKWLASKSKWVEAARTLDRVRTIKKSAYGGTDKGYVTRAYVAGNQIMFCTYSDLFRKRFWKSTSVGILLHFFIQLTSITPLMYFFTYICDMCGMEDETRVVFESAQYIILGLLTLVPVVLLDNARRVDYLTYGMSVITLVFAAIFSVMVPFAILTNLDSDSPFNWIIHDEPASVVLALFLFLISVYASSITSVSWLYTGEIFPDEARAKGTAVCMCVSWIMNAVFTLLLPLLFQVVRYYVFLALAIFCLIGAIIFSRFPETKYKVAERDEAFSDYVINSSLPQETDDNVPRTSMVGDLQNLQNSSTNQKLSTDIYTNTQHKQIQDADSGTTSHNTHQDNDAIESYNPEEYEAEEPFGEESFGEDELPATEESYYSDGWIDNLSQNYKHRSTKHPGDEIRNFSHKIIQPVDVGNDIDSDFSNWSSSGNSASKNNDLQSQNLVSFTALRNSSHQSPQLPKKLSRSYLRS
ncbi:hypothetical protein PSN45_002400 [Yamadazyma tenuis]|uniref:uncharacterized protein n=1 Tax=Candida tenuis TaxID=2315449 RepID=UPI0027A0D1C4|nr:hypothetical protein PSN45_002400 [Yamadazyma tenuis]